MQQQIEHTENSANPIPDIEFVRLKEVVKLFGVSRASFDRWQNPKSEYYRPDFPKNCDGRICVLCTRRDSRLYAEIDG